MPGKKTAVTLSVDDDVLKWFEAQGTEFQRGIANLRRSASGIARNAHLNQTNRFAGTASNLSLKFDWAYDTCGRES